MMSVDGRLSWTRIFVLLLAAPMCALLLILAIAPHEPLRSFTAWMGDALPWRQLARSHRLSLEDKDLRAAAAAYRTALGRNPLDSLSWEGLAGIESKVALGEDQAALLRSWTLAIPHSPRASWALANLLVREGRTDESLLYFRQAASDDPRLRPALFEMGRKLLDDPEKIAGSLIPEDAAARVEYLAFLLDLKNDTVSARPVWRRISQSGNEHKRPAGMHYVEALARAGRGDEAAQIWNDLFPGSGAGADEGGERIRNGDFEDPLLNAGLEWLLDQGEGYRFTLDDFQARGGSRSLRISFDGATNVNFFAARQWVLVKPDTDYEFTAAIKTENLTTDSGIFFSLSDVTDDPKSSLVKVTTPRVGSTPWTEERLRYRTGPRTQVVFLEVRRIPSTKPDNLLRGTVWIDSVSLRPNP